MLLRSILRFRRRRHRLADDARHAYVTCQFFPLLMKSKRHRQRPTLFALFFMPVHFALYFSGKDFLKFNESHLQQLPCQVADPIPLGEGAGVGPMKGADSMAMPDGSALFDLVQTGITYAHAAVGVAVRLRKELSMVKDIPVLFAIDQYSSWFTFSEYEEPVTVRSCRSIHARELSTVSAYRSMMHDDMMVGAFSHSTAVSCDDPFVTL